MTIISDMKSKSESGYVGGSCANCKVDVYESLWLLDDAYNVWMGRCPHCKALNYLSMTHGLRGYSSGGMFLVLPTDEEVAANNLPPDTITSGKSGKPADWHGSVAGELCHRLAKGEPL